MHVNFSMNAATVKLSFKSKQRWLLRVNFMLLYLYETNINCETYDNLLKAGIVPHQIEIENVRLDIVKLIQVNNGK